MVAEIHDGQLSWSGERDNEGHVSFDVTWLVHVAPTEGPATAMDCPGLPLVGSPWAIDDDVYLFAFCHPDMKATIHQEKEGDPNRFFKVSQKFSTKPLKRCQDSKIEDPLLEPQKVSGSFVKDKREGVTDRNGDPIKSSSHEPLNGEKNEWDYAKPTVKIEQNVADLELALCSGMVNRVNSAPLWGLPARCIKLSNFEWERKIHGTCGYYYTRTFEFDIDDRTHDRDILDEGTRALDGFWENGDWIPYTLLGVPGYPDPNNPKHFVKVGDKNGNMQRIPLNGEGLPLADITNPAYIHVEYFGEANFLLLNIPTVF